MLHQLVEDLNANRLIAVDLVGGDPQAVGQAEHRERDPGERDDVANLDVAAVVGLPLDPLREVLGGSP